MVIRVHQTPWIYKNINEQIEKLKYREKKIGENNSEQIKDLERELENRKEWHRNYGY